MLTVRLVVDLDGDQVLLGCARCGGDEPVDRAAGQVVLAATTATFFAAHARCPEPALA